MYLFAKCRSVFSIELGFRLSSSLCCIAQREEKERRGEEIHSKWEPFVGLAAGGEEEKEGKRKVCRRKRSTWWKEGLNPPVKKGAAGWGFKDKAYKACREASSPFPLKFQQIEIEIRSKGLLP